MRLSVRELLIGAAMMAETLAMGQKPLSTEKDINVMNMTTYGANKTQTEYFKEINNYLENAYLFGKRDFVYDENRYYNRYVESFDPNAWSNSDEAIEKYGYKRLNPKDMLDEQSLYKERALGQKDYDLFHIQNQRDFYNGFYQNNYRNNGFAQHNEISSEFKLKYGELPEIPTYKACDCDGKNKVDVPQFILYEEAGGVYHGGEWASEKDVVATNYKVRLAELLNGKHSPEIVTRKTKEILESARECGLVEEITRSPGEHWLNKEPYEIKPDWEEMSAQEQSGRKAASAAMNKVIANDIDASLDGLADIANKGDEELRNMVANTLLAKYKRGDSVAKISYKIDSRVAKNSTSIASMLEQIKQPLNKGKAR